jgi:hypothetical protein
VIALQRRAASISASVAQFSGWCAFLRASAHLTRISIDSRERISVTPCSSFRTGDRSRNRTWHRLKLSAITVSPLPRSLRFPDQRTVWRYCSNPSPYLALRDTRFHRMPFVWPLVPCGRWPPAAGQNRKCRRSDAKIDSLHAVDLVYFLTTPASLEGSGRIVKSRNEPTYSKSDTWRLRIRSAVHKASGLCPEAGRQKTGLTASASIVKGRSDHVAGCCWLGRRTAWGRARRKRLRDNRNFHGRAACCSCGSSSRGRPTDPRRR